MPVIRILVVDASVFLPKALARALARSSEIRVTGVASSGKEALSAVAAAMPDLVTLDLELPGTDALTTLEELKTRYPALPVIVVARRTRARAASIRKALSLGALDVVDKSGFRLMDLDSLARELIEKVRRATAGARSPGARSKRPPPRRAPSLVWSNYDLCVIGASTGGPAAVQAILERMPAAFPIPVAIGQHMPPEMIGPFAKRLDSICRIRVAEAAQGDHLAPGSALIMPTGATVTINSHLQVVLSARAPPHCHHDVDALMLSAAAARPGHVVGVLLTGMGDDGARGMLELRRSGALTIAESEATCVVYGMPRAAHARGGVERLLPLPAICALFAV